MSVRVLLARLAAEPDWVFTAATAALRGAGLEVLGPFVAPRPEMVASAAVREAVDAVVVGVDSEGPEGVCRRLLRSLHGAGCDLPVVVLGFVAPRDREVLRCLGARAVLGPEARPEDLAAAVRDAAEARARDVEPHPMEEVAGGD